MNHSFYHLIILQRLEQVYRIDQNNIFYIHGNAEQLDDLIFGHNGILEFESELEDNEETHTIYIEAQNAAAYTFFDLKKPVEEILKDKFFNQKTSYETIFVIGHSLNEIDMPYFKAIHKMNKEAIWNVNYHEDYEEKLHYKKLRSIGIPAKKINTSKDVAKKH